MSVPTYRNRGDIIIVCIFSKSMCLQKRNNNPKVSNMKRIKIRGHNIDNLRYADDALRITGNDDDYVQRYGIRKENEQCDSN